MKRDDGVTGQPPMQAISRAAVSVVSTAEQTSPASGSTASVRS